MSFEWITVISVTLLVAISPGADFAMVTRNALVSSRRAGIFTAAGIALSLQIHIAYAIAGLGLIISQSILLFNVIKFLGAAYLLWMGYRMMRAQPQAEGEPPAAQALSDSNAFRMGFLTNLLNPKATLFVVALFAQVVAPEALVQTKLLYGVAVSFIHLAWFSLVALFFSTGLIRDRLLALRHWIDRVFGALLAALGLSLAFAGATSRN